MKKIILAIAAAAAMSIAVQAQTLQTGYFVDNYTYGYRLNPAFCPDYTFIGLPGLSMDYASAQSNFGLKGFFYPFNGKTVTFLHPEISASEVLGNFKHGINKLNAEIDANLLAFSFKSHGTYGLIDVNLRNTVDMTLPYEMMKFFKMGAEGGQSYDLSGFNTRATSFLEVGIASPWRVGRQVTFGMRAKALVGITDLYMNVDRMDVKFDRNQWQISGQACVAGAYDGFNIATKPSAAGTYEEVIDFSNITLNKPKGPNGVGFGVDFGVNIDLGAWEISASIVDLGCIFWWHNLYGHTPGTTWTYDGAAATVTDGTDTFGQTLENAADGFLEMFQFRKEYENQELGLLPITGRLGVKRLMSSALSFGGLLTYRYNEFCPIWEVRTSADYLWLDKFDFTGSVGVNNFGPVFGAMANLRFSHLVLFAGVDAYAGKLSKQFIPVGRMNSSALFGANIIF